MQVFTGDCKPQFGERVVVGVGDVSHGYNPVGTSYTFPVVTIGLSLAVFAPNCHRTTNGRTDGIGLAKGGTICTKVYRPPKMICYFMILADMSCYARLDK